MSSIIFDFDIGSPYSYMAAKLIPKTLGDHAENIRWRPVLLGAVFKATQNLPPASNPPKGRYLLRELEELAELYEIPFRFPSVFPPNTLLAQRVLCATQSQAESKGLALAFFEAYWVHNKDISQESVVGDLCEDNSAEGAKLLDLAREPENKARLRAHTDAAIEAGVFGLPAFHYGDRFWWGHDRLVLLKHYIENI